MVNIIVNGKPLQVEDNLTIMEALDKNNIFVPRLCYLKEINEVNACRVCLVEIEGKEDLVPSCTTKVQDGQVIFTHSKKALDSRRQQILFLLSKHNYNCAECAKDKTCLLRKTAEDLNIIENPYPVSFKKYNWDKTLPIIRDNAKCISCGRCVNICDKLHNLSVWKFTGSGNRVHIEKNGAEDMKDICTYCGQCIVNCPTNALSARDDSLKLIDAINDKEKTVVLQIAPAVRVAWAETLGLPRGNATIGKMVSAAKSLGVDYVFDTDFSADLTIMEEGTELFHFLKHRKNKYPMFTSCCPGWVRYMKIKHPEFVNQLSTSKSPQQMFGAIAKTYFAQKIAIDAKNIFSVSIMPCVAKKYECSVKEVNQNECYKDVDLSITTREFSKLIRTYGIDVNTLAESNFDSPLGESTGAAVIFGTTGGVMEAALRTAYYIATGKNPDADTFNIVRGEGIRTVTADLNGTKVKAAVAYGLTNAEKLITQIKSGEIELDFVEIMTCPYGCINGGGQPEQFIKNNVFDRMKKIYEIDKNMPIRFSHENPEIIALYKNYLDKPLSEKAEKLLHTSQENWTL